MFKILVTFLSLISILQLNSAFGANRQSTSIDCAPELRYSLSQIQKLPEARQLIAKVQSDGPIRLLVNRSIPGMFGAFWDPDNRIIYVTLSQDRVEGSLIGSILFELHNASTCSQLNYYDSLAMSKKIDKESYVQGVERLEYQNSLKTAELADKGIQAGLFPRGARLPIYPNFEEHYRIQKMGGHSAWIANNYDQMSSSPHMMSNPG